MPRITDKVVTERRMNPKQTSRARQGRQCVPRSMASFKKLVRDELWLRPELSSCAQSISTTAGPRPQPQADQHLLQKPRAWNASLLPESFRGPILPSTCGENKGGGGATGRGTHPRSSRPGTERGNDHDPGRSQPDCEPVALEGCLILAGSSAWTRCWLVRVLLRNCDGFRDEEARRPGVHFCVLFGHPGAVVLSDHVA